MILWKKFLLTGLFLGGTLSYTNKINNSQIYKENMSLEELTEKITYSRVRNLNKLYNFSEEDLNKFNSWIDSTINESAKENKNCILVDKSSRLLYLIKEGKVDSKYTIELGHNPYEDKQKEGDCCTPEGRYSIEKKIPFGETNFYKALLINYPNKEDKAKGKTGGLIEIHGFGGKGYDWTAGCVSLYNKDMDKIFSSVKKGDKVTIVKVTSRNLSLRVK